MLFFCGRRREPDLQTVITGGAWTWFNDPRAVVMSGQVYAGAVLGTGDVVAGRAGENVTLHASFVVNDHCNPAVLRLRSGRVLVCYSRHGSDSNYYSRVSSNPDDFSSFEAEQNIGPSLGASGFTYANLVEVDDGIFNFIRCTTTGEWAPHFIKSSDGGATWSAAQKLLIGNRPYIRIGRNGANRIDLICTDGHPGETTTSVWHLYYSAGAFYKSDGTPLGTPPYNVTDLTKVYDGSVVKSWVWDVRHDAQGRPVVVYATFPNAPTDHRYCYARWDGSAWTNSEICAAGGTVYPVGDEEQPYYSGGVCIDPDDASVVYCSIETGSGGSHRNGGTFQIWRGATRNGGQNWDMSQLLKSDDDCFRPFKPQGTNKLLFVQGAYTSYTSFDSKISALTI